MAVLDACSKILKRLEPYKTEQCQRWEDIVMAAYLDSVSLSATGFYTIHDIGYNFETMSGRLFDYHVYGAGCSLVEIDCLTGE